MHRVLATLLERLDSPERPRFQRDHLPGSALDHFQCPAADRALLGLGDKLDPGDIPRIARGSYDLCR